MKHQHLLLGTCIAAALAGVTLPASVRADIATGTRPSAAPARVTQTVDNRLRAVIDASHLPFLKNAASRTVLADNVGMNHLQLVLRPSPLRRAQMEAYIASQHEPHSAHYKQWMTPDQFGKAFGVADSDIAAVTGWLTSQGFTVNTVYPNRLLIDFSGTAGQVANAFQTTEAVYTLKGGKHLANSSDISVPAALRQVVTGVMGLNDFHARPLVSKPRIGKWNAAKKGFEIDHGAAGDVTAKPVGQAVQFTSITRGLVPNDLMTIYGIRQIRGNGITGAGINIAVVEDQDMMVGDWYNFVGIFNLGQYGGSMEQINPAPPSGDNNCADPNEVAGYEMDGGETLLDAEWASAIAPGAHITVATCADLGLDYNPASDNFFGGTFVAANNLINADVRPDIISASYGFGEYFVDAASKSAIDAMWAQADAEGISVFVSSGDTGSNPSFNGGIINGYYGNTAVDANAMATSPHVTAVGGTDLADVLDGTTGKYFAATPSVVGGSALSYVPEIPWNQSCGNGVAAKAEGYTNVVDFCSDLLKHDQRGVYVTSEAGSGGPSAIDAKPAWQKQVFGTADDQSRDLPDVALFAGSYGDYTYVVTCTYVHPCAPNYEAGVSLSGGTSLSSPMFAGIQALIDQGLKVRGLPAAQGNAAPTLYALAAKQYGSPAHAAPGLDTCNADHGASGTANCIFHNVTRGSISSECVGIDEMYVKFDTPNCYYFGLAQQDEWKVGLTTIDAAPTGYGVPNKAYGAHPGWSFASGLGSVDTTNLLVAWRAYEKAAQQP